jgi:radical SAM-linked protein
VARPPHAEQAPAVQKLRVRFAKRDRLRFTSHRDFQRAFERALRRARVPVAFSHGFTPHPKVSYAGAAPTGAASEAEYLELALTEVCDPAVVAKALDEALPAGLDIVAVVEATGQPLADRLQASEWEITLPGIDREAVVAAVRAFLAAPAVEVDRMTKKGLRTFDARGAVVRLEVRDDAPVLHAVVRHQTPSVRPDDILAGLRQVAGLSAAEYRTRRLAQGPLDAAAETVGDPFTPDRG